MGAIWGEPVKVIMEEITGLPIPASSEIVLAGWCPPGISRTEGPFGEWHGYYAGGKKEEPPDGSQANKPPRWDTVRILFWDIRLPVSHTLGLDLLFLGLIVYSASRLF
jgi:hypothetical protein